MTLQGTLEASVVETDAGSSAVDFAFTVRNEGTDAVELQFSNAAKAEFVVFDGEREVWRFTEGRMFAQMLSAERLESGAETTYEATWEDARPGEYAALAQLRAREADCEAETTFAV